jgi:hypothetical protein
MTDRRCGYCTLPIGKSAMHVVVTPTFRERVFHEACVPNLGKPLPKPEKPPKLSPRRKPEVDDYDD